MTPKDENHSQQRIKTQKGLKRVLLCPRSSKAMVPADLVASLHLIGFRKRGLQINISD
jgi:hypothetical protein